MKIYRVTVNADLIAVCAMLSKSGIEINVDANVVGANVKEVLCGTTAFVVAGVKDVV